MRLQHRGMGRPWWLAGAAGALIALLLACVEIAGQLAGGTLGVNGGFEQRRGSLPEGWSVEPKAAGKGEVSLVRDPVHGGEWALKLAPNQRNSPWDLLNNPLGVGQGVPAASYRGRTLYVSGWLGAEGGSVAATMLIALRRDGGIVSARLEQPSSESGLVYHEDQLPIPDDSNVQSVILICIVEGTAGAAYFDDIAVSTAPPAARPARPREAAGDTGDGAEIVVRADRTVREIPRTLYGTNIEWIWDANGLWIAETGGLDATLVRLTREANLSLIRFPGGIFSDFYNWRDGIGPQSERRETQHSPGGPRSVHHFGTDEALAFAEQVGARLLITVNAGTGTAAEAAEWVRYVNKRPGRPPGQRVEYWEVGNELYIKDDSPHSRASTMPPDAYARKFLEFARAMRAVDPDIRIGAIGDETYSSIFPQGYPGWTERVLKIAGREMDFLSVHNAYAPGIWADKGWDVRTVYSGMLAAPALISGSLERLAAKIRDVVPERASRIGIAVTEWGPYFQPETKSRFADHGKTLGSALFVASTMKAFIESPRMEIANFFQLVDGLYMGSIGRRGSEWTPKPSYYALQIFTRHFGPTLVESEATSPTYDAPAVGIVDAVQDVPYLDAVASRDAKGGRVYLVVINKHFDRPIRTRIRVQGFTPRQGTAWTLSGTGIDANTGTELFRAPGVTWAKQAGAEPNPRIDKGGPREVTLESSAIDPVGEAFEYSFPPHSVTSLELEGRH